MSGGSLDYLYFKVNDAADRVRGQRRPLWEAFADHLLLVAEALHDCEWVMSGDYGSDGADQALAKVLQPSEVLTSAWAVAREAHHALGQALILQLSQEAS